MDVEQRIYRYDGRNIYSAILPAGTVVMRIDGKTCRRTVGMLSWEKFHGEELPVIYVLRSKGDFLDQRVELETQALKIDDFLIELNTKSSKLPAEQAKSQS